MKPYSLTTPDDYEIEPELRGPLPRRVRERSYIAVLQRWLTRGAVLLFCFFCWLASASLRQEHDWLHHQRTAKGVVLALSLNEENKSTAYDVTFAFRDQKKEKYEFTTNAVFSSSHPLSVNGPLSVYYYDTAPWDWRLTPVSAASIAELQADWYFGIGVGTVAVAVGLLVLKGYRASRIRLLREGAASVAMVTRRRIAKGSKGEMYRYLSYGWIDAKGAERSKEIQVSEDTYDHYPQFTPFTTICVPDNRFDSVPYFLIHEAEVEL